MQPLINYVVRGEVVGEIVKNRLAETCHQLGFLIPLVEIPHVQVTVVKMIGNDCPVLRMIGND